MRKTLSEHDCRLLPLLAVRGAVQQLIREIRQHLDDGRRGERLRNGIHLAIVGAPNVGKSSLLNLMCKPLL